VPRIGTPGSRRPPLESVDLVRAALRVSVISAAWTLLASAAAVTIGVAESSAVLVALGLIGLVDLVGSVALAFHFLHGLRHESFSERRERLAHRAVSLGLVVVGLASAGGAAARIVAGDASHPSLAGGALTAASLVALVVLARRKRSIGRRLRSRGLVGDANLSGIGAIQAALALAGIALTRGLGTSSADAGATLAVGLLAVLVGIATGRTELDAG
jgi:divalent metal cation (Fe/Co/Zn/Cd) transporter